MQETIEESNALMAKEAEAAPFQTVGWHQASDAKQKLKATSGEPAGTIKKYTGKPHGWKLNPLEAFVVTDARAAEKKAAAQEKHDAAEEKSLKLEGEAQAAEDAARAAGFEDESLNEKAASKMAKMIRLRASVIGA